MKPYCLLALLLTFSILLRFGELIPFVLPWNDDAPGITNLAHINHETARQHGYIGVDENAHFTVNGERIRFWGLNVTSEPCFPSHEAAEGIAARLAKNWRPDGDAIPNFVEFLAGLNPKSKDSKSPIQQSITWIDHKPSFVYTFLTPIGFPSQQLGVAAASDLQSWSTLALDTPSTRIASQPHNETHERLTITHTPSSYPAFSRLTGE